MKNQNKGYMICDKWIFFLYKTVLLFVQALLHAYVVCRKKLVVDWVLSSDLEDIIEIEVKLILSPLMHHVLLFTSTS